MQVKPPPQTLGRSIHPYLRSWPFTMGRTIKDNHLPMARLQAGEVQVEGLACEVVAYAYEDFRINYQVYDVFIQ